MLTPLSVWISAKWGSPCTLTGWSLRLCFYTGTSDSSPPKYSDWLTVCHHKAWTSTDKGPVQVTRRLMVPCVCACIHGRTTWKKYVRGLCSESHFNPFLFSFSCPTPLLLLYPLPSFLSLCQQVTQRPSSDGVRADDQSHGDTYKAQHSKMTSLKNKKTRPTEIPRNPPTVKFLKASYCSCFPPWHFTSSFFLRNTKKKKKDRKTRQTHTDEMVDSARWIQSERTIFTLVGR